MNYKKLKLFTITINYKFAIKHDSAHQILINNKFFLRKVFDIL